MIANASRLISCIDNDIITNPNKIAVYICFYMFYTVRDTKYNNIPPNNIEIIIHNLRRPYLIEEYFYINGAMNMKWWRIMYLG